MHPLPGNTPHESKITSAESDVHEKSQAPAPHTLCCRQQLRDPSLHGMPSLCNAVIINRLAVKQGSNTGVRKPEKPGFADQIYCGK